MWLGIVLQILLVIILLFYVVTVPGTLMGTLMGRVVSLGKPQTKQAFNSQYIIFESSVPNNNGHVDSIRQLLFTDNFTKPYLHVHILVHLLTTPM